MIDLSICIVNYNAKELTLNCIRSVYDKTKTIAYEIIIVDNNSFDGSQLAIQNKYPRVKVIRNINNKGFAGGSNQAMEVANGKYILLLNNDTLLKNNALDNMVAFLGTNPKVGALTCKLYYADGTVQHNCRNFPTPFDSLIGGASLFAKLFPNNSFLSRNSLVNWRYDSAREIDWVSGAVIMVRREVVEQVGLLDEKTFFMYWEDTDWCKRIHDAGWQIYFTPDAEIIHFTGQGGGKRSLGLKLFLNYHMKRSAHYYFQKHYYVFFWQPMAVLNMMRRWVLASGKAFISALRLVSKKR